MKISIGDKVIDKRIYENEVFSVTGIKEGKIEITGDFSGGINPITQSDWVTLTDEVILVHSSGWCNSWYCELPVIGDWYEIGIEANLGFNHMGIRQFQKFSDLKYGFFDNEMRQIFPQWYKRVELSGFAIHHLFKKPVLALIFALTIMMSCTHKKLDYYVVGKEYNEGGMCHDESRKRVILCGNPVMPVVHPATHHHVYESPEYFLFIARPYSDQRIKVSEQLFNKTALGSKINY